MQVKKWQWELDMEQQSGSKSGKEYTKAVYCHPAYLTYVRSTSCIMRASLVAQTVKCLPTMQETWVWSLGWEDPLEKEMATHSSTLVWKMENPMNGRAR